MRVARILAVVVVGLAACSSGSSDDAGDLTRATDEATPSSVAPSSTSSRGQASTTAPTSTDAGDDLAAVGLEWVWPPPFVVPGTSTAVEVVATGPAQPDAVVLSVAGSSTSATLDVARGRWNAGLAIPSPIEATTIELRATATSGGGTVGSAQLVVPVVGDSSVIEPRVVALEPTNVIELEYGDGPGQVGYRVTEFEGELQVPLSVAIDPATSNVVILDSVNRRLQIITETGEFVRSIELPGQRSLQDVVVLGTTGRAVVSETRGLEGEEELLVHEIDLDAGNAIVDGPVLIEAPGPPSGTQLVWNPALDAVFAAIWNPDPGAFGYYRMYDTDLRRIEISRTPELWWAPDATWVPGRDPTGTSVGFTYADTSIFTRIPHEMSSVVDEVLRPDGTTWFIADSLELDVPGPDGVHYYLGRTDLACRTSVIAEIGNINDSALATRQIVADESGAFVVDIGRDAYRLRRHELELTGCDVGAVQSGAAATS